MAGEAIHGFYFGCDHRKIVEELIPLFPECAQERAENT